MKMLIKTCEMYKGNLYLIMLMTCNSKTGATLCFSLQIVIVQKFLFSNIYKRTIEGGAVLQNMSKHTNQTLAVS